MPIEPVGSSFGDDDWTTVVNGLALELITQRVLEQARHSFALGYDHLLHGWGGELRILLPNRRRKLIEIGFQTETWTRTGAADWN